ncbi:MAG: hypothetical protein IT162_15995 [Bryobacterales bacterium]|nr:hypothetical protein [Bryobacterales bacterium]
MGLTQGSVHLSDAEFVAAFESCTLTPSQFRHADHLRLAWLYLHQGPLDEALDRVRGGIQAFAAHHGATGLYHETITAAWVRLLATHAEPTFAEFLEHNEARLGKDLLHRFWSPELLASAAAKSTWVDPDRQPLPR